MTHDNPVNTSPWRPPVHWLLCLLLTSAAARSAEPLRDGDIVFHSSRSAQSEAIERATKSPYSHMGMIVHREGKPYVFEAIATVRYTPLASWTARGDGGKYVVKRLKKGLTSGQTKKLLATAKPYDRKPYDLYFEWSNDRIYCSELVWKMYRDALGIEIGRRQKLREFDLTDPVVQAKMRERYGRNVPLDEPVISPAAMFESALLTTVRP
jgi:hypothetical protein